MPHAKHQSGPVTVPGALPPTCEASLSQCTDQLNTAQGELEQYLPMDQQFERGGSNPALEARMEKRVAAALHGLPLQHNIECHGDTCATELPPRISGAVRYYSVELP